MILKKLPLLSLLICLMIAFQPPAVFAQAAPTQNQTTQLTGTRKQLATIIFAGLAGAILGLSTLSFYGKPQEKLDNIAVGAALGIIGGAIYTTYQVATAPYEMYDVRFAPSAIDKHYAQNNPISFQYSWNF